jgi:hypothetical protein
MHDSVISVGQYLNATSLNAMTDTSDIIPSMESNNGQSIFRNKTRGKIGKTPEIASVTFIRMEQLAPEGITIANNDGQCEDYRAVSYIFCFTV